MIEELSVYRGAGFQKLPFAVFVLAVLITLPFVLAGAAYTRVRRRLRGPLVRVKPGALYIGSKRHDAPIGFDVEGLYGGGGRVIAELRDGERIELPTEALSYADADELATTYAEQSAPVEAEGRYR